MLSKLLITLFSALAVKGGEVAPEAESHTVLRSSGQGYFSLSTLALTVLQNFLPGLQTVTLRFRL